MTSIIDVAGHWSDNLAYSETNLTQTDPANPKPEPKPKYAWTTLMDVLQRSNLLPRRVNVPVWGDPVGSGSFFHVSRIQIPNGMDRFQFWSASPNKTDSGNVVAVKRVKRESSSLQPASIDYQIRLVSAHQEVRVLAKRTLSGHKNITKLLAVIWEERPERADQRIIWPTLVMEYYPFTLSELQDTTELPIPVAEKAEMMEGVSMGIAALHDENICHGDIKSENILIEIGDGGKRIPKLADFSCSLFLADYEGEDMVRIQGTKTWRAPELKKNDGFVKAKLALATDFYSLGLLYWRVMGADGKNPFFELELALDGPEKEHEKIDTAIQTLKELDCVAAIAMDELKTSLSLKDGSIPAQSALFLEWLTAMLAANPTARMALLQAKISDHPETVQAYETKQQALTVNSSVVSDSVSTFLAKVEDSFELVDDKILRNLRYFTTINIGSLVSSEMKFSIHNPGYVMKKQIFEEILGSATTWASGPHSQCKRCCQVTVLESADSSEEEKFEQQILRITGSNVDEHTCTTTRVGYTADINNLPSNLFALNILALFTCYIEGYGVARDYHEAVAWLVRGASSGMTNFGAIIMHICSELRVPVPKKLPLKMWMMYSMLLARNPIIEKSLKQMDPSAHQCVKNLRSKLYNGIFSDSANLLLPCAEECQIDINIFDHIRRSLQVDCLLRQIELGNVGADMTNEEGWNIMHALCGNWLEPVEAIRELHNRHPLLINVEAEDGATPLLIACRAGRFNVIRTLLELGAQGNISTTNDGATPLHWLVLQDGAVSTIEALIACGADVFAQNSLPSYEHLRQYPMNTLDTSRAHFYTGTPLHWATAAGVLENVRCLLRNGACVRVNGPTENSSLALAVELRRPDIVQQLLCYADPRRQLPWNLFEKLTRDHTLLGRLLEIRSEDDQDKTTDILIQHCVKHDPPYFDHAILPLIERAVTVWPLERIKRLFSSIKEAFTHRPRFGDASTENNGQNIPMFTLLHEAHIFSPDRFVMERDHAELLNYLFEEGMTIKKRDADGRSYLHHAAICGSSGDVVRLLFKRGARGDERCNLGITPLHEAIQRGHVEVAKLIVANLTGEQLADQCTVGGFKKDELFGIFLTQFIRKAGSWEKGVKGLEYVLDQKPFPVNFVLHEQSKTTMLHAAAGTCNFFEGEYQRYVTVRTLPIILARYGEAQHLDSRDFNECTPIHLAAFFGNAEAVRILYEAGASLNLEDKLGKTPLDVAFDGFPGEFAYSNLPPTRKMVERWMEGRQYVITDLRRWGAKFASELVSGDAKECGNFYTDFAKDLIVWLRLIRNARKTLGKDVFEI